LIYGFIIAVREYARLKERYAEKIIANWQESSDPEKSVHEDLGIAAYLSCLWKGKPTTFVDLGCGNGLLVFILTSEVSKFFFLLIRFP
jgi:tRNASer (uridine44-2'-O)-methyltransferase